MHGNSISLDRIQAITRKYHRQSEVVTSKHRSPVLDKPDGSRLLTEALSAKVKTILADKTSLVSAEAALTGALSVFSWAREPNGVVGHFKGFRIARARE